jgi:hypothetical protein
MIKKLLILLQHRTEKWELVFGKIRCENKNREHRAGSYFRHDALGLRSATPGRLRLFACACLAGVSGMATASMAAEAGAMNWGPGALGLHFGVLPPVPGIFLVNQTGYFSSSQFNGANGKRNSMLDLDQHGAVSVSRIMGVWPVDLNGWRFATQAVIPYTHIKTDFDHIPVSGDATGFGNLGLVQLSNYSLGGFHNVGASIAYVGRTSSYSASRPVNVQTGYSSWDASVHYNYFDPTGLDFGVMAGYHYNNRNPSTDYRSGDLVGVDFKVSYPVTEKLKIGGYGGYLAQIQDDKSGSNTIANNRYKGFNMGPSVIYNFGPVEVSLSYQFALYTQNATKSNSAWLELSMPLYVPKPPPH